ncbi:RnfH family protein [Agitococcus lubricus]|uniref:UPF0125 protein C8N29_101214 n=1 Tax=Agitococcus lubricus TaxID=1077255 RepID=A0A2T5J3H4_9GAMM|nr:RnfH family protein [Agitococcus lubricus]PTQ91142.1 hypothetical protein C8N29_101214 [Agitococcus lubricus]
MSQTLVEVEVAYALPHKQLILTIQVPEGTSLYDAVVQSRMVEHFPDLDLSQASLGVFGKLEKSPKTRAVCAGERIEIYRPLLTDPKEARKARAAKAQEARAKS